MFVLLCFGFVVVVVVVDPYECHIDLCHESCWPDTRPSRVAKTLTLGIASKLFIFHLIRMKSDVVIEQFQLNFLTQLLSKRNKYSFTDYVKKNFNTGMHSDIYESI